MEEMADHQSYPTITDKEFVGKLKVWKETTTTSPSGAHLGHHKALIALLSLRGIRIFGMAEFHILTKENATSCRLLVILYGVHPNIPIKFTEI